jgi:hypothetical protein
MSKNAATFSYFLSNEYLMSFVRIARQSFVPFPSLNPYCVKDSTLFQHCSNIVPLFQPKYLDAEHFLHKFTVTSNETNRSIRVMQFEGFLRLPYRKWAADDRYCRKNLIHLNFLGLQTFYYRLPYKNLGFLRI